jgi:DNA transformation protein
MVTRLRSARPKGRAPVLPGFGPKSTAALAVVGVHSLADLEKRDPFAVYRALKERVPGTSLNFLYALIGAVEKRDWREIQRTRRTEILMRLDEMSLAPR